MNTTKKILIVTASIALLGVAACAPGKAPIIGKGKAPVAPAPAPIAAPVITKG
jgi:hypothetical protein